MDKKIIVRIKGGLGNQLFCYAAARRLSIITKNELYIDYLTGFSRDIEYKRKYELDYFNLPVKKALNTQMLFPFERPRRAFKKIISKFTLINYKSYIVESDQFNILNFNPKKNIILDGLWQDQKYFSDIHHILRNDLKFNILLNDKIISLSNNMTNINSVALHVRWFDPINPNNNLSLTYYKNAIKKICELIENPHFYIFSDDITATKNLLSLENQFVTYVSDQTKELNSIYDLYLMSKCKNFILANSTFSWWAAWLSSEDRKYILIPYNQINIYNCLKWNEIKNIWEQQ